MYSVIDALEPRMRMVQDIKIFHELSKLHYSLCEIAYKMGQIDQQIDRAIEVGWLSKAEEFNIQWIRLNEEFGKVWTDVLIILEKEGV